MRRLLIAASTLVLCLVVASGGLTVAQSPAAGADAASSAAPVIAAPAADPVAAVNAFLDAANAKQFDTLPSLICAAERDATMATIRSSYTLTGLPEGVDATALQDALIIAITDRTVELKDTVGDTATVSVTGTSQYSVTQDAVRGFIEQWMQVAGESPTPDAIDQAVAQMYAQMSVSMPFAHDFPVVNENGGWLVCDPSVSAAGSPAASGAPADPGAASPAPG
jgi:hypothetical protein